MSAPEVRHSALYIGSVRHRRYAPVEHVFRYRHAMLYLDLDELHTVFAREPLVSVGRVNVAWFRRADYLGDPAVPLDTAVRDLVTTHAGRRPTGPVRMLTTLRTAGYAFNPVTFYFCFAAGGGDLEAVVAEITNTPWLERHAYVLPAEAGRTGARTFRFRFPKQFHVSPFLPMDLEHDWRFTAPGARLHVHMEDVRDGRVLLDATLALKRTPLGAHRYTRHLLRHPLATLKVTAGIYIQALRLWWKRCPFFSHPKHAVVRAERHPHAAADDRTDPHPDLVSPAEGARAPRAASRARPPAGVLGRDPAHP